MKIEEAILELKTHRRCLNKDDVCLREAMDLAIGALWRRKPKKFKWIDGNPVCPVCGEDVWEFARKLTHPSNGGLYENEKKEIFDRRNSDRTVLPRSQSQIRSMEKGGRRYSCWR